MRTTIFLSTLALCLLTTATLGAQSKKKRAYTGIKPSQLRPLLKRVKVNRETKKIEISQKVFFATGKSKIRRRSFDLLNEVSEVLKSNRTMAVLVEGHTDSVGSSSSNLRLSQRRADAVRNYLIDRGIAPSRLTAIGFGEERPIESNRTKAGREVNRRVEFTITKE